MVLLVDDDRVTLLLLDRLLRGAGLETRCAVDLASAEKVLRSESVSLVLLDVHLPDGNGLDLCATIASGAEFGDVPVLFISSNNDEATKVRGFAVGAVDYITKPLASGEVLARVRTHLRLRYANEKLATLQAERVQRLAATQQSLMPSPESLPQANFQVCVRQILGAGGDFYDVYHSGENTTDFVVADVSGHDLGSSLWTASFKTLFTEYASALSTPGDVVRTINRTLRRVLPETIYFTAIYARLNREFNTLTLINAGHPAAILLSIAQGTVQTFHQEGDVVGIFPVPVFGQLDVSVHPGDRIFLYTDGILELSGSRSNGLARLEAACLAAAQKPLAEAVPSIVDSICDGHDPDDDIILLGICV